MKLTAKTLIGALVFFGATMFAGTPACARYADQGTYYEAAYPSTQYQYQDPNPSIQIWKSRRMGYASGQYFWVSTGHSGNPTPTGKYTVQKKVVVHP
jgi:hypothetical protein